MSTHKLFDLVRKRLLLIHLDSTGREAILADAQVSKIQEQRGSRPAWGHLGYCFFQLNGCLSDVVIAGRPLASLRSFLFILGS